LEAAVATELVEAWVRDVALLKQATSSTHVIILDTADSRVLCLFIGSADAAMLALIVTGTETSRPLTHSFYASLIKAANVRIDRVVIQSLVGGIFRSLVHLQDAHSGQLIDSRPSDSLALALLTRAPIFVTTDVLDQAGMARQESELNVLSAHARDITASLGRQLWGGPKAIDSTTLNQRLVNGARPLTTREEQILRLVAAGNTNVEVGLALGLSPFTISRHLANVYGKLGVKGRAHAVGQLATLD
jgi:uncharacterized protein